MQKHSLPKYPDTFYYTWGETPVLLITSGIHGDEYELIEPLTESLQRNRPTLPPFLYIPVVSPSAVRLHTRLNERGLDLNRQFLQDHSDPEVEMFKEIVGERTFKLMVSFHEDPELDSYYIYDIGHDKSENERLKKFNVSLDEIGINLFTGVDDPEDLVLNHEFVDGYHRFAHSSSLASSGMIEDYVMDVGQANEVWIPEIPGKIKLATKAKLIEKFVTELLTISPSQ